MADNSPLALDMPATLAIRDRIHEAIVEAKQKLWVDLGGHRGVIDHGWFVLAVAQQLARESAIEGETAAQLLGHGPAQHADEWDGAVGTPAVPVNGPRRGI